MTPRRKLIAPLLLAAVLALGSGLGAAAEETDPHVAWLREHAVAIALPAPATPTDQADRTRDEFSDLEPLKRSLDGVQVVVLGEATRGDGSTMLAKARLVRFLHERMGFDVLVLDCGFFRCGRGAEAMRAAPDRAEARQILVDALSPMRLYTESAQFQPLLDLAADLRGGEHPLVVAGAGPELNGSGAELMAGLRRLLGHPDTARDADGEGHPRGEAGPIAQAGQLDHIGREGGFAEMAEIVAGLDRGDFTVGAKPMPSEAARRRFLATLDAVRRQLDARRSGADEAAPTADEERPAADRKEPAAAPEELAFYRQALDNLEVEARMTWQLGVYRPGSGVPPAVTTLANRQTAANLLWLAEDRYAGHKIVVSARTVFIARALGRLETGDLEVKHRLERFTTVGDLLEEELGDRAYLIGFTAFDGRAGTPFQEPYDLLRPTEGSFEDLMARTGLDAAFVDLRGLHQQGRRARWLTRPLIARPLSFLELRGSWPRHLDAFLFLRTMEPSRRIEPATR